MKILLINPPAENTIIGNNPPIIDEERGYNPPLGLLYLAGYLEKYSKYKVEVIDTQVEEINYEKLGDLVVRKNPDVVGITAMTFTLIDVFKTVDLVKKVMKNVKIVLGGTHIRIFPSETINLSGVDYLVLGEGEIVFKELLDHIDNFNELENVKGLVFKKNGKVVNTGLRDMIEDLDSLPFPARHLVPHQKYTSLLAKRTPVTTMFTSRGCPFKCTFCNRQILGKRFRAISAKKVVDEMEECLKMGIKEFLVYDDTFAVKKERVIEICDEIVKRKLNIGWDIRTHINTVDEEILEKLRRANCERIHYGVEAGTDRVLKILKKGITIERAKKVFKMTKRKGISTLAYFMIGNPTETREDVLKTVEVAKELDPDFVHFTILTPFPATAIYNQALNQGIIKRDLWREFASSPDPNFQPPYWEENLSREELLELIRYAYKSFYTRPGYIVKRLMKVRSSEEFKRKVKAGLRVLGM